MHQTPVRSRVALDRLAFAGRTLGRPSGEVRRAVTGSKQRLVQPLGLHTELHPERVLREAQVHEHLLQVVQQPSGVGVLGEQRGELGGGRLEGHEGGLVGVGERDVGPAELAVELVREGDGVIERGALARGHGHGVGLRRICEPQDA